MRSSRGPLPKALLDETVAPTSLFAGGEDRPQSTHELVGLDGGVDVCREWEDSRARRWASGHLVRVRRVCERIAGYVVLSVIESEFC
jgi:hypothetical protein